MDMKRIAAFTICLAAAWLLYATGMELFIGWYSGAEPELGLREWATLAPMPLTSDLAFGIPSRPWFEGSSGAGTTSPSLVGAPDETAE